MPRRFTGGDRQGGCPGNVTRRRIRLREITSSQGTLQGIVVPRVHYGAKFKPITITVSSHITVPSHYGAKPITAPSRIARDQLWRYRGCRPRRRVQEHIRRGRSRRDLKESERVSLININSINKDNDTLASYFDILKNKPFTTLEKYSLNRQS